jgi:hypothetical protein
MDQQVTFEEWKKQAFEYIWDTIDLIGFLEMTKK